MAEQSVAPERLQEGERTSRREAVRGLAADMLRTLGKADGRLHPVTWEDGDTAYALNRTNPGTPEQADWLHIVGPGGEHDAFNLAAEGDLAASDTELLHIADALARQATLATYEHARARFAEQGGPSFRVGGRGASARFEDFTSAEYEAFIMVRVGGRAEPVVYDLTQKELRRTDAHDMRGPVHPHEPAEAHIAWMLDAVYSEQPIYEDYGTGRGGRSTMYVFERRDEAEREKALTNREVEEAHSLMRVLRSLPAGSLYVDTEGDTTVVRGIAEHTMYDDGSHSGYITATAVGLYYNGEVLHLEAFPTNAPNEVTAIQLDLVGKTGSGSRISGEIKNAFHGLRASDELFDYTDELGAQLRDLQPCTPDITAQFRHLYIRDEGMPQDTVQ